jgi:hypothetical protein
MYCDFPNLNWARLRVFLSGGAEIFDCDGKIHRFKTGEEALSWLNEDEFTDFDKLSAEDEIEYGITLSQITPPQAQSDEDLRTKMYVVAKKA